MAVKVLIGCVLIDPKAFNLSLITFELSLSFGDDEDVERERHLVKMLFLESHLGFTRYYCAELCPEDNAFMPSNPHCVVFLSHPVVHFEPRGRITG